MNVPRVAPVAVWLAALLGAVLIIARAPFATDMSAFLPRSDQPAQQVLLDQLTNGAVSHLILVGLEGASPDALAALSKRIAKDLRSRPDIIAVANGEDAGLGRDRAYFWGNRYLLSPDVTPERFQEPGLRAALQRDLQLLSSPYGLLVKHALPADPTGEMIGLLDRLTGSGAAPASHGGVWFSKDLARAVLMVQTRPAGFDLDAQEAVVGAISRAFGAAKANQPGASAAKIEMTGPAVFAVTARATMKADATRFSLIATALVAIILGLAYRNPILVGFALLPVVSGALAGLAVVALVFGFVHGITLGFGVTLIGEAVDYAIYLFTQTGPDSPPRATLRRIGPTLRLGLMTSVVGFGAMLASGFPGFVQLGLFTISGLIMALLVTVFVLPVFIPRTFQGAHARALGQVLTRVARGGARLRWLAPIAAGAALVVVFTQRAHLWEDQLTSLNPVPVAAQKLDQALRNAIGAPDVRYLVVIGGNDEETVLQQSERVGAVLSTLKQDDVLSGFDAPYFYLPSLATQRARQAALPGREALRAALGRAVQGLPFKSDIFQPFLDDVARAKHAPPVTQADLAGSVTALRLQSMLIERKGAWIAILPLRGVTDAVRLKTRLRAMNAVQAELLDLKSETDQLLGRYLDEALTLAGFGSLAILALLAVTLRSAAQVARVLAPLAGAVAITAALLILWQGKLSLFNLFGLLLVVAVGSNYTLFFARAPGRNGGESGERVLTSVGLANLCTVIAFGVLSFSAIPVLHGIGMTVAIGAFLSLILAAVFAWRQDPGS